MALPITLLTALALPGCGGGDPGGGGGAAAAGSAGSGSGAVPSLDACALVTPEDATEVLGASASQPDGYTRIDRVDEQMGTAMSNCVYMTASYRSLSVVVTYRRSQLPATFEALKAEASTATGAMAEANTAMFDASQPVDGLGDFAFWIADGGGLSVYAERHYQISINIDPATAGAWDSARPAAITIATRILDRL